MKIAKRVLLVGLYLLAVAAVSAPWQGASAQELVWTRQFGTDGIDRAFGGAADAAGSLYVVGDMDSAGAGASAFVRKYDPSGNLLWADQFGESARGVALDASGNIYVAGSVRLPGNCVTGFIRKYTSAGTMLWHREISAFVGPPCPPWSISGGVAVDAAENAYVVGSVLGVLPGQTGDGSWDAFVRKYDSGGSEVWTRQFGTGGFSNDGAAGAATDGAGNLYVTGQAGQALPGQTALGDGDAYIRKYDSAGTEVWTRQFGTSASDNATGVAVDGTGNLYVTGATVGTFPAQNHFAVWPGSDSFVRKYDSAGTEVWTRQFGASGGGGGNGIRVDGEGNVYVAGRAWGALAGQSGAGTAYVRKFHPNATVLWTLQFGASSSDAANGVAVDSEGNVNVVGSVRGALPGQTWLGTDDAFVIRLSQGAIAMPCALVGDSRAWVRQFGSSDQDAAFGVAADGFGNVYAVGRAHGALPGQTGFGLYDGFLRKYDPAGAELWTRQFGREWDEWASAVAVDGAGSVYVAGAWDGSFLWKYGCDGTLLWKREFEAATAGGVTLDAAGNIYLVGTATGVLPDQIFAGGFYDAFLRKYDASGIELWTRQFGSDGDDGARGAAADGSGNVYVVGQAVGALPGQTSGGAFVRKYDAAGTEVWTRQFGSPFAAVANGAAADATGNVYVVGNSDSRSAFVRKYDAAGTLAWTRDIGMYSGVALNAVALDRAGGVYVAAGASEALPGQTSAGAFVRKYDAAGTEVWTRQFGASWEDGALGVAVDGSGNVLAVGSTPGTFPGQVLAGSWDAFVARMMPGTLGLTLGTNAATFRAGDTLTISASVDNFGLPQTVDFYFGALLPDGDTIAFFTDLAFTSGTGRLSAPATLQPIVAGVDLTAPFVFSNPSFFTHIWTGGEPPGTYVLFLAAVRSGALADNAIDAGDLVVLATAAVTFAP